MVDSISGSSDLSLVQMMMEKMRENLFTSIDKNSDGLIDSTELKAFSDLMKEKLAQVEAANSSSDTESIFSEIDTNADGKIDKEEFAVFLQAKKEDLAQKMAASGSQLAAQSQLPPPIMAGLIDGKSNDIFAEIDTNQDGQIDKTEFDAYLAKKRQELAQQYSGTLDINLVDNTNTSALFTDGEDTQTLF